MEMNSCTIVTLTGYEEIFRQFQTSVEKNEQIARKIVVTSGGLKLDNVRHWAVLKGIEPFSFTRNANLGIAAAGTADVLLVNDDVQFLQPNTVSTLQRIAYEREDVGILSPQVEGQVAGIIQRRTTHLIDLTFSATWLAFVCIYLKRSVLDRVGLLDERFFGYGQDDVDYCLRVRQAGLGLAVTPEVVVKHGFGSYQGT